MNMKTAVLFMVFNRIETTRKVFEAIREARPPRLYIAADGPRQKQTDEDKLCEEVRKIAAEVDWPCEVKTLFREKNLGCKLAVSEAITWFFEQELEGIILEDDCLPDQSFFGYCEELLKKYKHEPRVMTIGGTFLGSGPLKSPNIRTSYFFSRTIEVWGWASWRRAWKLFDLSMSKWPQLRNTDWLRRIGDGDHNFQKNWDYTFQKVYLGEVDTWDFQWVFAIWSQEGLAILPTKNLVANIGFDENATHTKSSDGFYDKLPIESIEFPLKHPKQIKLNQAMDEWIKEQYIILSQHQKKTSIFLRMMLWIKHKVGIKISFSDLIWRWKHKFEKPLK